MTSPRKPIVASALHPSVHRPSSRAKEKRPGNQSRSKKKARSPNQARQPRSHTRDTRPRTAHRTARTVYRLYCVCRRPCRATTWVGRSGCRSAWRGGGGAGLCLGDEGVGQGEGEGEMDARVRASYGPVRAPALALSQTTRATYKNRQETGRQTDTHTKESASQRCSSIR